MKLLFTSIGRRVELVQAFRSASIKTNCGLSIIGADMTPTAPALKFCDETIIVPSIDDENYISFLIDYCRNNNVDAVIPTIDTDLLILSQNKKNFGKTKVVISDLDKIAICRNKEFTYKFFDSIGLNSPYPVDDYTKYIGGFPAFIKPKDGSSSIYAYKMNGEIELKMLASKVPDYIIQPFIDGTEYTVDVFCDFDGNPIFITPRIRMMTRSGEVLKTKISQDDGIIEEVKMIVDNYKPCGPITIQLIKEKLTGCNYYIEINPRFGGGAPLSIKAGADSAEMLIRLIMGEHISYQDKAAENEAIYSRFDQSVRVDE